MAISISIGKRVIGAGHPCFVIAEAGVNHNGDAQLARKLIDAAVNAKADAVKFQLFNPREIAAQGASLADYQRKNSGRIPDQFTLLSSLTLSEETYCDLAHYAQKKGIEFIVTPFDAASAQFLASLSVRILKIPSGEITNLPFLTEVAILKLPVILSTGMSSLEEIKEAVAIFRNTNVPLAILHCVSAYPTPANQVNLRAMDTLRIRFSVPVGFSDHTEGGLIAVAAAACGAAIVEKHLTLDRELPGPDQKASVEPDEFAAMVRDIRQVEAALGSGEKKCQKSEENVAAVARRSVVVVRDLPAGSTLTGEMLAIRRPGTGIPPKHFHEVIGKKTSRVIKAGGPLTWDMLS